MRWLRTGAAAIITTVVTAGLLVGGVASPSQAWAGGNTAPTKTLSGAATGLNDSQAVAFDAAGNMYVTNQGGASVTMYPAGWASGNTAPTKTLQGAATLIDGAVGIAFDAAGNMYVSNLNTPSVTMYAAGWANGNTAPTKTLTGAATLLNGPMGLAFDASDNMYVANVNGNSVTVYSSGWATGNTAPTKTLTGAATLLNNPGGVGLDSAGNTYVSNINSDSVTMYTSGWATGNTAPTKTLTGAATLLSGPFGLTFDAADTMYVANINGNRVTAYASGWATGNTAPTKTLSGAATGLNLPNGVAFDADGNMNVTNRTPSTVTMYNSDQTVTFNANGGSGSMAPQVADAPTALTANAFTRTGYTFNGWNTQAGGGGTAYADGATYSFVSSGTLFAQWKANSGVAQNPVGDCVKSAGKIPRRGVKQLMAPVCKTNAGQRVGVTVRDVSLRKSASRGDVRYYTLFCQTTAQAKRGVWSNPKASGNGWICKTGALKIRTYGYKLKLTVVWKASAVGTYSAYKASHTYKT